MAAYQLTSDPNTVLRESDGASVPVGQATQDSRLYAAFLANGGIPDPVVAMPAQLYTAALAFGCTITSASTPAINGTYPITVQAISDIQAQQVSILTRTPPAFTNGLTTRPWLDINGTVHVLPNTAIATAMFEAVAQYVDALVMANATAQAGGAWVAPAQPAPIA